MEINNNKIDSGYGSTNVIGDNNLFQQIVNAPSPVVRRSYLYDICHQILEAQIEPSEDYSIEFNADWSKKLDFNNISTYYVEIFTNDAYAYAEVSEIMGSFANRETLVRKVRNIYLDKEKEREASNEDGDFVLKGVFDQLENAINIHENSLGERMPDEERDRCIWLLMFYTFTKCQLLRKPLV